MWRVNDAVPKLTAAETHLDFVDGDWQILHLSFAWWRIAFTMRFIVEGDASPIKMTSTMLGWSIGVFA